MGHRRACRSPGGIESGARPDARRETATGTYLEVIHSWIVTVDHKKLGILYIGYALIFLLVAGVEALLIRAAALLSAQPFRFAVYVQPAVHDARHHDGVPGGHADSVRVWQLSCAADDRRAGHGVSAAECVQLLDQRVCGTAAVLQLHRRQWAWRGRDRRRMWRGLRMRR